MDANRLAGYDLPAARQQYPKRPSGILRLLGGPNWARVADGPFLIPQGGADRHQTCILRIPRESLYTRQIRRMAERVFTTPDGTRWHAWDVLPSHHTDWSAKALRRLPSQLAEGWLCFEAGGEKRRLHPIPTGWEREPDSRLSEHCRRAERVVRRPAPAS